MNEIFTKIWGYITLKKDNAEGSFLKSMHTINKISILIFLVGMVILVFKIAK
jgi:hypothetical protein